MPDATTETGTQRGMQDEKSGQNRYCAKCAYCLNGLQKPRCPECGQAFDPYDSSTWLTKPSRRVRCTVFQAVLAYVGPYVATFLLALVLPSNLIAFGLQEIPMSFRFLLGLFSGVALAMLPGMLAAVSARGTGPTVLPLLVMSAILVWVAWLWCVIALLRRFRFGVHVTAGTLWSLCGLALGGQFLLSVQGCPC